MFIIGRAETCKNCKLYGDWENNSRDGRTYWVAIEPVDSRSESDRLFTEVTSISGTAISIKYGRVLTDSLPEIETLTFAKAKARLALGLYEQGNEYIQEITSKNLNPEVKMMEDEQIQYMILLSLSNLRKSDPTRYKYGQVDIEGFCQILGIDRNQYLFNAGF